MLKDVIISITGEQSMGEDTDKIELTTDARYGVKNGSYYISYDESEMLGVGNVKTVIYIKPDSSVVLQRTGGVESRLIVEKGKRSVCLYGTAEGHLAIGVFGEKIQTDLTPSGGSIRMKYTIDTDLKLLSHNTVNIKIREVK